MKRTITLLSVLLCAALLAVSCGNNPKQKTDDPENNPESVEATEAAPEAASAAQKEPAKAAPAKKWYEQDFTLTEVMYVGKASITRMYARKGNVVIGTTPGSKTTTLFFCTDSTRTEYLVGNEKKQYRKVKEKTGFSGVDDAIYKYLKGQMSETVFGKTFKPGEEGVTTRDTTIFGRPARILTKETSQKNSVVDVWGKSIMYVDKENGLPYYKWAIIKTNGAVTTEGKSFEVTEFSANPTYEGLIVSLDGLTEVSN